MTWKLRIAANNGSNFINLNTGLTDYDAAVRYAQSLYGDDAYVVGQEYQVEDNNAGGGFLSWLLR